MRFNITVPAGVPIEVINAALAQFGGAIAQPKVRKAADQDAEPEFEPVFARHTETGEVREIDGVSVQKAIAKIMAEVRKGQNSDGRHKSDYPVFGQGCIDNAQEYMGRFCSNLHHKPAEYTNGVTA